MQVNRIVTNLPVADIESAKSFYTDFLGLGSEEFNLGWVARLASPDGRTVVQLVTKDATSDEDSAISVLVQDVEEAWEEARRRGYEVVRPLTREGWGVHRFLLRAPDGTVVNFVHHPR